MSNYNNFEQFSSCDTNVCCDNYCTPSVVKVVVNSDKNIHINNTLFVDAEFGNDLTGERENINKPYQTISSAYSSAISGDIIYVWSGNYSIENLVMIDNISIYLNEGVIITTTSDMFIINSDVSVNILGFGSLVSDGTSILNISSQSRIIFEALDVTVNSGYLVSSSGGTELYMNIWTTTIYSDLGLNLSGQDVGIIFRYNRITALGNLVTFSDDFDGSLIMSGSVIEILVNNLSSFIFQSETINFVLKTDTLDFKTTTYPFLIDIPASDTLPEIQIMIKSGIINTESGIISYTRLSTFTDVEYSPVIINSNRININQLTSIPMILLSYGFVTINTSAINIVSIPEEIFISQLPFSELHLNADYIESVTLTTFLDILGDASKDSICIVNSAEIKWIGTLISSSNMGNITIISKALIIPEFSEYVIDSTMSSIYFDINILSISGRLNATANSIISLDTSQFTMNSLIFTMDDASQILIEVTNSVNFVQNIDKVTLTSAFPFYILSDSDIFVNIIKLTSDSHIFQFLGGIATITIDEVVINSGRVFRVIQNGSINAEINHITSLGTSVIAYNSTMASFFKFVRIDHNAAGDTLINVLGPSKLTIEGDYIVSSADYIFRAQNQSSLYINVNNIYSSSIRPILAVSTTNEVYFQSNYCEVSVSPTSGFDLASGSSVINIGTLNVTSVMGVGINISGINTNADVSVDYNICNTGSNLYLNGGNNVKYVTKYSESSGINITSASTISTSFTFGGIFYSFSNTNVFFLVDPTCTVTCTSSKFVSTTDSINSTFLIPIIFLNSIGQRPNLNITQIPAGNFTNNVLIV